jgi:O-antigen/teichoic acid export membrane protein
VRRSVQLIFSTNVAFLAFSVLTSLLGAWALGPEGRGDFVIITTWLYVFSLLGTLGLPVAHRYWMAKEPEKAGAIHANTLILTGIGSAVMLTLGWLLVPMVLAGQEAEVVRLTQIFLLNIPVILLTEMLRGQLEGAKLFGWLGIARISFIGFQATAFLALYAAGRLDLGTALVIVTVGQLICCGLMFVAFTSALKPSLAFDFAMLRAQLGYGIRSYFGSLTEFAVWRLDQMMLTALAAPKMIGLYAVAVAIAEITSSLASSVSDALMPEVSGSKSRSDSIGLLGRSLRLTFYAQAAALAPLWVLEPYILYYVFGESFLEASGALRLLLIASMLWSAGQIVVTGLNGFGRPGLGTLSRMASAGTTVVSLWVLLPLYGIEGAAIASIVGYGVMFAAALTCLINSTDTTVTELLKPRKNDLPFGKIMSIVRFSIVRGADA